jgi:hypothetical protein
MRLNPEFRRNVTLELTTHRLVVLPAVIALICLLAYVVAGDGGLRAAGWAAFWLYAAITIFWGTQLACASVLDEFRDKTWDSQRLSALGPWTIAWGKLLGGTVVAWYGGAICLLVFVATRVLEPIARMNEMSWLLLALAMTGSALLMHASGLLFSLLLPRAGQRSSSNSIALLMFGVVAGVPLVLGMISREPVFWWGRHWDSASFAVASCWSFAAWAVTGVYRRLCAELQVRTTPSVWLGLAAFLTLYLAGFAIGRSSSISMITVIAAAGFTVTIGLTYVSAWVEKRDAITVRRLILRMKSGDRRRTLEEMPCWLVTAPLALVFSLYLSVQAAGLDLPGPLSGKLPIMALVAMLMAVRDIGLLYFFSFARNGRNPEMTTAIYLIVLYWPLPALLSAIGLAPVAGFVLPYAAGNAAMALIIAAAQAALVVWLAHARWREHLKAMATA